MVSPVAFPDMGEEGVKVRRLESTNANGGAGLLCFVEVMRRLDHSGSSILIPFTPATVARYAFPTLSELIRSKNFPGSIPT